MNENRYNDYDDDTEINLLDLMFYLLKRWRGLLLAVVLGAVLGFGIYLVKDHRQKTEQADRATAAENIDETEEFDESTYDISDDVEANMELAYQYCQMYRKQLEYNQKSIIMQLDPNAVYMGELKYYLSAGADTGLVSALYQNILSDKDLLTELQQVSGLDCEVPYMKELISSDISRENDSSVNINNLLSDITDSMASVTKNAFVIYQVISTNEDSCERMIQVLREKVQQLNEECADNYENFRAIEVNDAVRKVTDNSYLNLQKNNVDQLNTYLTNVQKLENALTDSEKEYYCKKYLAREYTNENEDQTSITLTVEIEPVSKVKWIFIGAFLGILFWGCFEFLKYVLDGTIKTGNEAHTLTHLPIIGRHEDLSAEKNKIDRIIGRLQRKVIGVGDSLDYIVSVVMAVKGAEMHCSLCVPREPAETRRITKILAEKCKNLCKVEYCSNDLLSMETTKVSGKEIIVVSTGKTKRSELERELEICYLQHIEILGLIIVENI